jgi:lysyl-tRNA synthetase class 2
MKWQPKTHLTTLQAKAALLKTIRSFFESKNILEVQTPLLCAHSVTDPYVESIATTSGFLQTSPEYAMKKLLAVHKQSIYQICKAFRDEDQGRWHSKEFLMLEWYAVDANLFDLMEQVCELIFQIMPALPIEKITYRDLFLKYLNVDPFAYTAKQACDYLKSLDKLPVGVEDTSDLDDYLQIMMCEMIEPKMDQHRGLIVYDYPAPQAALSRLANRDYGVVGERCELYIHGIECGNGFYELQDSKQQSDRFKENQRKRHHLGLRPMEIDPEFLQALDYGLPQCSGIAIGLDRILMLKENISHIEQVNF